MDREFCMLNGQLFLTIAFLRESSMFLQRYFGFLQLWNEKYVNKTNKRCYKGYLFVASSVANSFFPDGHLTVV